jgi:ubiquinone/menaquinone biosynthesis C-methylase UbiE
MTLRDDTGMAWRGSSWRKLIQKASGKVLEVAVGTGKNLPHYPNGCAITAIDLSPKMPQCGASERTALNLDATFHVMDAEALDFPDSSFDTVVSTLSTCTFPDPSSVAGDGARVPSPVGKFYCSSMAVRATPSSPTSKTVMQRVSRNRSGATGTGASRTG